MHGFADRLKGLIEEQDGGDVSAAARRLGLAEVELIELLYGPERPPRMHVLRATVREYVVDPGWLLTGLYDVSELLGDRSVYAHVVELLLRYSEGGDTPPEVPRLDAPGGPGGSSVAPRSWRWRDAGPGDSARLPHD